MALRAAALASSLSQRYRSSGLERVARLTSGHVWDRAVLAALRERDEKIPPPWVQALEPGPPVNVTLCIAIGRAALEQTRGRDGIRGRAERADVRPARTACGTRSGQTS
jgi:phage gp36-like protein